MVKALGELILPNDGLGLGELVHLDGDDILELLDELRDISSFVVPEHSRIQGVKP